MSEQAQRWAVGFCTFRRPDGMARLIDHVAVAAARLGAPVTLVTVDNDGSDEGIEALARTRAAAAGLPIEFVVERTPGISAARNAVFARADAIGARFMAMIDDDEWPSPEWLTALDAKRRETGAHVIGGPVSPVFPAHARKLEAIARWWSVEKQFLDGKPFVFCTCNFLIDLHGIREMPRPLFDPRFGLSGGGDTVFFRSLFRAGHAMAWADDARVFEEVPDARASRQWMRSRRYRVGNHAVNWEVRDQGRVRPLLKTLGLTARLAIYPLLRREPEAPMAGWRFELEKVRGRWNAHRGALYMEYARGEAAADEKACR